jgi:aminoglycoside 3-N-acetyltransferase
VISDKELGRALDELALDGRPVMVHASLRSLGGVVLGGADALLDRLLERRCTVMVPSFSWERFALSVPPQTMRPSRNGYDYAGLLDGPCAP